MISIAVRKSANLSAAIILLAAVAATPVGFSQSRFGADADRQQQIIERIEQEEAANGPYSEGLIGPLSDLALIYQDRGDHELAVAVIRRLQQVVRANEGLHSLEQIPLIQQMIANEEATGRAETAWQLEQDLLTLVRRHPDDIRAVPVFRETAAKRVALFNRYLAGESPPQVVLGCYYGWPRNAVAPSVASETFVKEGCTSGARADALRTIASDAQRNYADAIAVMLRNELYASDELRELELELVRTIDLIRAMGGGSSRSNSSGFYVCELCVSKPGGTPRLDLEPWRSWMDSMALLAAWELPQPLAEPGLEQSEPRDGEPISSLFYAGRCLDACLGKQSLQRLLAYEIAASAPFPEQVEAFVRLADWEGGRALEQYERALKMLHEAGAQALIDELFAPKTPVVLPTFTPNPLATAHKAQAATGYIDVAFEITRYGSSRRVQILEATENAKDTDKTGFVQLIERSRFRPRLTDGEFARASPVILRYYLTE